MLEKAITFVAYCDFCSESFDTDEDEFLAAVDRVKREGWKIFKDCAGDWQHKCGCCQEEGMFD